MGADNPHGLSDDPHPPELAMPDERRGAELDGTVLVDARALQDERFSTRGVGSFLSALLQGRRQYAAGTHVTAVVAPALPSLALEAAALFARVQALRHGGCRHP